MTAFMPKSTTEKSRAEPQQYRAPSRYGLSVEASASLDSVFVDNRPQAQRVAQFQTMVNDSPRAKAQAQLQSMIDNSPRQVAQRKQLDRLFGLPVQRQEGLDEEELVQGKFAASETPTQRRGVEGAVENRTGMPDSLKGGLEQLSGLDLSGVRVHRNSAKPAQLNALAYAQGQDIHLGPGQERHLPHEGWHAVQQMQGRVRPTMQAKGVSINDDKGLEHEADVMGAKAAVRRASKSIVSDTASKNEQEQLSQLRTAFVARRSQPTVQRLVMTNKRWIKSSSLVGRPRSEELLAIDDALLKYNNGQTGAPENRMTLLAALENAISGWENDKGRDLDTGRVVSNRGDAVDVLKERVAAELNVLKAIPSGGQLVVANANEALLDIYNRAILLSHEQLSKPSGTVTDAAIDSTWAGLEAEAYALIKLEVPQETGLDRQITALGVVVLIFPNLTRAYHGVEVTDPRDDLEEYLSELAGEVQEDWDNAVEVKQFIGNAIKEYKNVKLLTSGSDVDADDPFAFLDDNRGALIDEIITAVGKGTEIGGYLGTSFKGNAGFTEFIKPEHATAPDSNDRLSGGMDMTGGLTAMPADYLAIVGAVRVLADSSALPKDRRAAQTTLVAAPLSLLSSYLAFVGGALTATKGNGTSYTSGFGFDPLQTDLSTDVKMAGDFAGVISGIVSSIKQLFDVFNHLGDRSDKQNEGAARKRLEDIGLFFKKVAGTLTSLANNSKALMKIGYQISGGGQVAKDAVSAAGSEFMGKAVPGLNLVMGILESVQQAWKLGRIGIRRQQLTSRIDAAFDENGDLISVQAMEFAHGTLVKRSTRIGINLGHALSSILAGSLNLSGIGLAPGLVVSLASTASRIGQVGLRLGKQRGREKKAQKRAVKKPDESYQQWEHRKRVEASGIEDTGKRRWQQFKTAIDIKFTFNWDKTAENKSSTVKAVAMETLRMNDTVVFTSLGIKGALIKEKDYAKRVSIVTKALEKRD